MENDIILDGIIQYTLDKKLKWEVRYSKGSKIVLTSKIKITKTKSVVIDFFYISNDYNLSYILVYFMRKGTLIRKTGININNTLSNRFKELTIAIKNNEQ